MPEIILHHFDASPFAEKIRLALGLKSLSWRSVQIPVVMPKPELTALTGGYRKTPVMQIGADIYCDTRRIALELEHRYPKPSLFPDGNEGLGLALAAWSDKTFFEPGAGLSMGTNEEIPETILADRKAFFNFMDFETLRDSLPHLYGQLKSQVSLVERQLADGRAYFLGDAPAWVDILAYFPIWMARGNIADVDRLLSGFKLMNQWSQRIAAIGHGDWTEMSASAALQVARASQSQLDSYVDADDPLRLAMGSRVLVSPVDYGIVPVSGQLERLTLDDIAIRRLDAIAGEVVVHFPRAGYRVEAADSTQSGL